MITTDWLARRESLSPNKTALIDAATGEARTYRQWNRAANRTAHLLRGCGVGVGDRVAVLAMNSPAVLDLWFACGKLGAIFQPLNWRLTTPELLNMLLDAGPLVICYDAAFAHQVESIRAQVDHGMRFVALETATGEDLPFTSREAHPDTFEAVAVPSDAPWVLCYTGGTTGLPKGAILTHGNITWNAINTMTSWNLCADDVTLLNAPLFHSGGLNVFTAPLVLAGGTSIICRTFDPAQVFDLVERAGVTVLFGVPTMFAALQQHECWPTADFSRVRLVISGGAPCPQPIFEACWARGIDFKTGYGLTEAGPNTFWLPPEDVRRKPGAVGRPLFFVDVRVVDGDGQPCGPDTIGELQIRGPHVFAGYWRRPAETASTLVDGWLHTGDLARYDAEGYYWIVGRSKDVIISGGENIYPAEVENVLVAHPDVLEAALIGVPDQYWGELGRAIVVPRPGHTLDPAHLLAFAGERLARYKLPRSVVLADTLPRTAAGKIDKRALHDAHGEPEPVASTATTRQGAPR